MALIIILALSAATTYLSYRVWYLAGVLADNQDLDESNLTYITSLEQNNQYMYTTIVDCYNKMKEIDRLGSFESDDESGTTFRLLNDVITKLKQEYDNGTEEEK
jgi:hypothetical protein